jgi:hypothetical protein
LAASELFLREPGRIGCSVVMGGWVGWEGWKRECGEGCIQTKWPDVVLDLDGAAEQGDAHGAPGRQAREAKVQSNLSLFLSI